MDDQGKSVREHKQDVRAQRRRLARKAAREEPESKSLLFVLAYSLLIAVIGSLTITFGFWLPLKADVFVESALQRLVLMLGFIVIFLLSMMILVKKYMPKGWLEQIQFSPDHIRRRRSSFRIRLR